MTGNASSTRLHNNSISTNAARLLARGYDQTAGESQPRSLPCMFNCRRVVGPCLDPARGTVGDCCGPALPSNQNTWNAPGRARPPKIRFRFRGKLRGGSSPLIRAERTIKPIGSSDGDCSTTPNVRFSASGGRIRPRGITRQDLTA
jgi:hypothetical protein